MARSIATNRTVELAELLEFVRPRHRLLLVTARRDGRPQISPVTGGVDSQGRIVISTYPKRAKARNAETDPRVSVLILSDDWNGPWVQVDGDAEVLHMPEAADGLVEYFRCISGEHPDWDEYRDAMRIQDKSLIRITPTRWGPIATGGFPPEVAAPTRRVISMQLPFNADDRDTLKGRGVNPDRIVVLAPGRSFDLRALAA